MLKVQGGVHDGMSRLTQEGYKGAGALDGSTRCQRTALGAPTTVAQD